MISQAVTYSECFAEVDNVDDVRLLESETAKAVWDDHTMGQKRPIAHFKEEKARFLQIHGVACAPVSAYDCCCLSLFVKGTSPSDICHATNESIEANLHSTFTFSRGQQREGST